MQELESGKMVAVEQGKIQDMQREILPDGSRKYAGPFYVGEILEIKGGRFRIHSFGKKMMVLEGLPGTVNGECQPKKGASK